MHLKPCSDITASTANTLTAFVGEKSFLGGANKIPLWAIQMFSIKKKWFKRCSETINIFLPSIRRHSWDSAPQVVEWFIEDQALSLLHAPPPPVSRQQVVSLSQSSCVAVRAYWQDGGYKEMSSIFADQ